MWSPTLSSLPRTVTLTQSLAQARLCSPPGLEKAETPWGAPAGAGSSQDPSPHGGPSREQPVPEGLQPPERLLAGAVWEEALPEGGRSCEKFPQDCPPRERAHAGAEAERDESSPRGGRSSRNTARGADSNPPLVPWHRVPARGDAGPSGAWWLSG